MKDDIKELRKLYNAMDRRAKQADARIKTLEIKVDTQIVKVGAIQAEVKEEFRELREANRRHIDLLDGFVNRISDQEIESVALQNQVNRHENWIDRAAQKLKIKQNYA